MVRVSFVIKENFMEGNITITKKEYLSLIIDSETLNRLECGGVDNWHYYGEALNPESEPNLEEFEDDEKERISKL